METKPAEHIFNVGNPDTISIKDWVTMCYLCLNRTPVFVNVYEDIEQRNYFSFYHYEYYLDVQKTTENFAGHNTAGRGLKRIAAVVYGT